MEKMQLSYRCFFPLVYRLNRPDISTPESLCMFLFGTASNAAVFRQMIIWMPQAKRKDGGVYKSDAELGKEVRRSAKTIERSRSMMKAAGFSIKIMKANGTPTNHYYFDLEKFLAFAANKLGVSVETVREGLFANVEKPPQQASDKMSKSENRTTQNVAMTPDAMSESGRQDVETNPSQNVQTDFDKTAGSLTYLNQAGQTDRIQTREKTTTTSHPSHYDKFTEEEVVVDSDSLKMEIHQIHLLLKVAHPLIETWVMKHGLDRVKQLTKRAIEDPNVNNRGGWVIRGLQGGWEFAEKLDPDDPKSYNWGKYADFIQH